MTNQPSNEKQEKDEEKQHEKSPEEKNWDEKWRRDPLNAATWAVLFIWAGIVLLLNNLGLIRNLIPHPIGKPGWQFWGHFEVWSIILIGAGVIVFIEVIIRLLVPAYRRPIAGNIFFAIFLIGIGLGNVFGWNIVWPVILIALGISVLLRGFLRRS
jgi:hypothetical protein